MGASGITYMGGATGVTIKTFGGYFDGGAMRTLSTLPVVLMPDTAFTTTQFIQLIGFSIYGGYSGGSLAAPAQLTWDLPIYPMAEFSWQTSGNNLISMTLDPATYASTVDYYLENNINGGVTAPLVLKSLLNSPGADFGTMIYKIFYIESDILVV